MTTSSNDMSVTVDVAHLDERIRSRVYREWWRMHTPLWLDIAFLDDGSITFTPNGKHANGTQTPPSRRMRRSLLDWIAEDPAFLDGAAGGAR